MARRLREAGVAAAPVATAADLAGGDYLAHRGFFTELDHPDAGRHPHPGLPIHLSRTPDTQAQRATQFGGDNMRVLRDILALVSRRDRSTPGQRRDGDRCHLPMGEPDMPSAISADKSLFPRGLTVHVQLDDDPRYRGSIHDDDVARARGYKAALVPGAFVYGHISRVAIEAWGQVWSECGGMGARFRRPVYNGDVLTIRAAELEGSPEMRRAGISAVNEEGEEVASGWVGLPDAQPAVPDISGFAILPRPEMPPRVAAGELQRACR